MKVKRIERGYTIYLSDYEIEILRMMEAKFNIDDEWPTMRTGSRRSWSRRTGKGSFLRTDTDARTNKF